VNYQNNRAKHRTFASTYWFFAFLIPRALKVDVRQLLIFGKRRAVTSDGAIADKTVDE
jgi:hypothetical protein